MRLHHNWLKARWQKGSFRFWIEKTVSASFWMNVLTDLKSRGVDP